MVEAAGVEPVVQYVFFNDYNYLIFSPTTFLQPTVTSRRRIHSGRLPGGTRLAALRTHDQKNGLQSSDRRGICKNHGKSGSGRTWDWSEAILGGSGPVSCDGKGKAHRKWANGCAVKLLGTTPA